MTFAELRLRYEKDARGFVRAVWGSHLAGDQGKGLPDKWQDDVLEAYSRGDRRISIVSAPGVGKTAVVAWCAIHQMVLKLPQKTGVTSPSGGQMEDALWNEIKMWLKRMPPAYHGLFEVKVDRIELRAAPEESFVSMRTSRRENPEGFQGLHCDPGSLLFIADEASGIDDVVYVASSGAMSQENAQLILISNATRRTGFFYDSQTRMRERYTCIRVTAYDSSRIGAQQIADIEAQYGKDSNEWRVLVMAEFPRQDKDAYLPEHLVRSAVERDVLPSPKAPIVWGADIARGTGDNSALCKRQSNVVLEPVKLFKQPDTPDLMKVVGWLKHEWDITPHGARPSHICVDTIGLGAGVADRLRELGLPAQSVNVHETASIGDESYDRVRDQLWGSLRAWLERRDCKLPNDPVLLEELISVGADFNSKGQTVIEKKAAMKKRLKRSPDCADALMLTFAVDTATMLYGTQSSNWNEPLVRGLAGVV